MQFPFANPPCVVWQYRSYDREFGIDSELVRTARRWRPLPKVLKVALKFARHLPLPSRHLRENRQIARADRSGFTPHYHDALTRAAARWCAPNLTQHRNHGRLQTAISAVICTPAPGAGLAPRGAHLSHATTAAARCEEITTLLDALQSRLPAMIAGESDLIEDMASDPGDVAYVR